MFLRVCLFFGGEGVGRLLCRKGCGVFLGVMIADDYREIEAGYLTKRNGSSSLDREEFKVTEGEVVEGRSLGGNGSKGEGEPVERTKFLKRSFDSQTSMSLRRARQVVNSLLKESRAEDVTYDSVRVVVLDVRLPLNQAFFALEENGELLRFFCIQISRGFGVHLLIVYTCAQK